jgi:hypothetical protein
MQLIRYILPIAALLMTAPALAQPAQVAPSPAPADTASPEALLQAMYDTISGPKEKARDWNRLRSLMVPEARFVATGKAPSGKPYLRSLSVEEFIAGAQRGMAVDGFFERGVIERIDRSGNILTIVSPYESRHAEGEKPFARGVNHFQMWKTASAGGSSASSGKAWAPTIRCHPRPKPRCAGAAKRQRLKR